MVHIYTIGAEQLSNKEEITVPSKVKYNCVCVVKVRVLCLPQTQETSKSRPCELAYTIAKP